MSKTSLLRKAPFCPDTPPNDPEGESVRGSVMSNSATPWPHDPEGKGHNSGNAGQSRDPKSRPSWSSLPSRQPHFPHSLLLPQVHLWQATNSENVNPEHILPLVVFDPTLLGWLFIQQFNEAMGYRGHYNTYLWWIKTAINSLSLLSLRTQVQLPTSWIWPHLSDSYLTIGMQHQNKYQYGTETLLQLCKINHHLHSWFTTLSREWNNFI